VERSRDEEEFHIGLHSVDCFRSADGLGWFVATQGARGGSEAHESLRRTSGGRSRGKDSLHGQLRKCHGDDARGRHNRPSLRSERIEHATDGELAWILRNGNTWKGMPSWSSLPEPERWQIIAYLRSLPPDSATATTATRQGDERP